PQEACAAGGRWRWGSPPPPAPSGWQFCGTHTEFGLSVDRSWFDDSFAPALSGGSVGGDMTPEESAALMRVRDTTEEMWTAIIKFINENGAGPTGKLLIDTHTYAQRAAAAGDVNALAAALAPKLPPGADPVVFAKAVADELHSRLAS